MLHQTATAASVERLFKEHNKSLLRFLRAKGHASHDAHEVAQEAYVRILGLHDARTISYLQAYLFQTAANLSTNRLIQASRRRNIDGLIFLETENTRLPEHLCSAQCELDVVARAIGELPHRCAAAFVLATWEDLSCYEIGKRMGLTDRQVRRYVRRATEHCRSALAACEN
jgi:RNA polymerase sigma factor (sigma-70 family)